MPAFYEMMRKVINDPSVEVIPEIRMHVPAPLLRGSIPKCTTR